MESQKRFGKFTKKTIGLTIGACLLASVVGYSTIQANRQNNEGETLVSREREYVVSKGDLTAGTNGAGSLKLEGVHHNFNEAVEIGEVFVKEGQVVKVGDPLVSISEKYLTEKLKELNEQLEVANIALKQAQNSKQSSVLTENKSWNDRIQGTLAQFEEQKEAISERVKSLNEKIEAAKVTRQELQNKLSELTSNEEVDQVSVEELKQQISVLDTELSTLETEWQLEQTNLKTLENNRQKELETEKKEAASNKEISDLNLVGLDSSITNAQKEVDKIKENIAKVNQLKENSVLTALVDGVVQSVGAQVGALSMVETSLVTIGESTKVFAELTVSQTDISKIKEGQVVKLDIAAYQDVKFTGTVSFINLKPASSGNSTTYSVTVELDEASQLLLEGMTVNAQFILKEVTDVLLLANKAITLKDGKQIVKVKDMDGNVSEVEITTGFSDGRNSEILSGLSEGDIVVVGG